MSARVILVGAALLLVAIAAESNPIFEWKNTQGHPTTGTLAQVFGGYAPCDRNVTQMSGYFNVNSAANKNYFYWAFQSRSNPTTDPVVLWMTGGPGCSSTLALLQENGPCKVNPDLSLRNNPYSWNNFATMIYIDQPAGVGFSYSNGQAVDHNETEVANDMYYFVQAFLTQFPQFRTNPFFVYGESYGGHYAPATAHRLWQGNQAGTGIPVKLTGLSVGNGLTDPQVQMKWYAELAYNWCRTVLGHPCVSQSQYQYMMNNIPGCISLVQQCNAGPVATPACNQAYYQCLNSQLGPFENTGLNVYDIRKQCDGPLCYNMTAMNTFMNQDAVQTALGVPSHVNWVSCSDPVNSHFNADWMRNFQTDIPDLLNSGIRVLIYAGDMDFICNWIGNKHWATNFTWSGNSQFMMMEDKPWYVNQVPAGMYRSMPVGNHQLGFTFLQVHGAGHMVPMDQPERALKMLGHFLNDKTFELGD